MFFSGSKKSYCCGMPGLRATQAWVLAVLAITLLGTIRAGNLGAADQSGSTGLPAGLKAGETISVKTVVDGDTLLLEDDRVVHLVGIQAPAMPSVRRNPEASNTKTGSTGVWPLAADAAAALAELLGDKPVSLSYSGNRIDRHGRVQAHVTNAQGLWLQGELLHRGLARVYSFADNRTAVAEMLTLERIARTARRGIWSHPYYAVRPHDAAEKEVGQFQLIEGRILKVAIVGGRAYLNFGEDWRSDFTLVIDPVNRRLFKAEGLDPLFYEGRRVRARGWLGYRNGATINVTHPEQIEVLDK
ncbi:thermonuclease family protein [Pelagibius sp. Alg239-R121]|uniref:thermonuclease family protein n=1 Tax=Pelagibius sp. Alg239-R121 TaxID=2993448 RepID=UPI0024A6160A|nr:thermonuclease family protein [Pelagibius sp. Alg239-R121]